MLMKTLPRAALLAAGLLAAIPAFAADDVAQQAQALINAGKANEALSKLESHLSGNPQDAAARFMRGLALVKLNRSKDAIRVYADLTRDYPNLPEPYNNLAALYAAQGDYVKARDALELAVTKNPGYALAHENLGDIYASLASAAYSKASTLNPNGGGKRKLAVVSQLATAGSNLSQSSAPQAITSRSPQPAAVPAPAPASVASNPVAASVIAPAAAPSAAAPVTPKGDQDSAQKQAVLAAVDGWAKAWAGKNADGYLAAYAQEFTPEGGLSRETWAAQRRERIGRAKDISVKVEQPEVTVIEDGALRVSFRQVYKSDTFNDSSNKVLELIPIAGGWKIVREYSR